MLIKERKTDISKERFGGTGDTIICHYMDEALLPAAVKMYAEIILKPGCSLGYIKHSGNCETLRIISGVACYSDDGKEVLLYPGDSAFCPEGHSHSVGNAPDAEEDLHIQALVVNTAG